MVWDKQQDKQSEFTETIKRTHTPLQFKCSSSVRPLSETVRIWEQEFLIELWFNATNNCKNEAKTMEDGHEAFFASQRPTAVSRNWCMRLFQLTNSLCQIDCLPSKSWLMCHAHWWTPQTTRQNKTLCKVHLTHCKPLQAALPTNQVCSVIAAEAGSWEGK